MLGRISAAIALLLLGQLGLAELTKKTPHVVLPQGVLQGFTFKLPDGAQRISNVFLGVPYAQPPVGERRFEKPQPLPASDQLRLATNFPPPCAAFGTPRINISGLPEDVPQPPEQSEDCLYLNVLAPAEKAPFPNGYPVLVFIHGGGFAGGATEMYGFQELANEFNGLGALVVTVQYRLGVFGFFSTGDPAMPGNLGLWDQRAALQWVREHIAAFGGNPAQVTVMGQNAGAASVGALSLSRHARDLFQQAVEMSGSIMAGWAMSDRVVDESAAVAALLGCQLKTGALVKECMRNKPVEEIFEAGQVMGWRRDAINFARFQPRMDGDFFDAPIDDLLQEAPKKPTIQGINSQESMIMTLPFPGAPQTSKLMIKPEQFKTFGREDLVKFIKDEIATPALFGENVDEARAQLIWFYADRNATENLKLDPFFYLTRYTQLLSDSQFAIPSLMEVKRKSEAGWPVYLYLLNYMNPRVRLPVLGTYQTYEFPYIFGLSITGPFEFDAEDRKLQSVIISALANFVHTGNPSSPFGPWPHVTDEHPLGFFDMRPNPVLRDNLMLDRLLFWRGMAQKFDYDLVRDLSQASGKPALLA